MRVIWDEGGSIATRIAARRPGRQGGGRLDRAHGRLPGRSKLPYLGASSGMAEIVNQLQAPMVGVSIANYDDNQHAQNENLRLGNLWDGIEVYAGLLADLNW